MRRAAGAALSVAVTLAATLLVPFTTLSVAEAKGEPRLVIKGRAGAYATLRLRETVVVHPEQARSRASGTYSGFAIYTEEGRVSKGNAFFLPSWKEGGVEDGLLSYTNERIRLKPGEYRVYLFGDADAEIEVPLSKTRSPLHVTTNTPVEVHAESIDIMSLPIYQAEYRRPIDIPGGARAYVAAAAVVEHHQAGVMEACVAERDALDCVSGGDLPSVTAAFPSPGAVGQGHTMIHGAGSPTPGPMDILFRMGGIARPVKLLTFYLVVSLA